MGLSIGEECSVKEKRGTNMEHRNWKDLQNDEIYAIWYAYLRYERLDYHDPLNMQSLQSRPMRLTPLEIIKLVDELMNRLEIKEKNDK